MTRQTENLRLRSTLYSNDTAWWKGACFLCFHQSYNIAQKVEMRRLEQLLTCAKLLQFWQRKLRRRYNKRRYRYRRKHGSKSAIASVHCVGVDNRIEVMLYRMFIDVFHCYAPTSFRLQTRLDALKRIQGLGNPQTPRTQTHLELTRESKCIWAFKLTKTHLRVTS